MNAPQQQTITGPYGINYWVGVPVPAEPAAVSFDPPAPTGCTCPLPDLMARGCDCGHWDRTNKCERAKS